MTSEQAVALTAALQQSNVWAKVWSTELLPLVLVMLAALLGHMLARAVTGK